MAKLRPETYELNVDFEHIVATRGDLVSVAHDAVLIGLGTADAFVPPAAIEALASDLPNATLVVLEDAGHEPFQERDRFRQAWMAEVLAFLERYTPR